MKYARALVPVLCAIGACSGEQAPKQSYTLTAFEAVGVQPDADGAIIPDSQKRLPAILLGCGIDDFQRLKASDSAIVLWFELEAKNERALSECIRSASPDGVTLDKTVIPKNA